ncbi:MAG TPA: biotin/lipoyl-containing protein [Beijerinckiaceae bacterium]|nr:biotin/lipoyl-containing protein [Beijerinckiaceae bacterium]
MIYLLTVNGKERRARIEEAGPGRFRVELDGEPHYVSARHTEGSIYSIVIDAGGGSEGPVQGGKSYEADVEVSPEAVRVAIGGEVFEIGAIDERRKRMRAAAAAGAASGSEIHSPMPGKVVKVLAPAGTPVKRGQGVIVVEAMKMENELTSPKDGVVKQVTVAEGAAVDGGALLVVIE